MVLVSGGLGLSGGSLGGGASIIRTSRVPVLTPSAICLIITGVEPSGVVLLDYGAVGLVG